MLRPIRRPSRLFGRSLLLVVLVAMLWPAGVGAARVPASGSGGASRPTMAGSASAARAKSGKPRVVGLGVKDPDGGRGQAKNEKLQHLDRALRTRPTTSGSTSNGRQPLLPASPPVQFTQSTTPPAQSIGWAGVDQSTQATVVPAPPTGTNYEPPDPWVAVGPNDVVQTVNTMVRMTDRKGTLIQPDEHLYDFFRMDELTIDLQPIAINGVGDPHFFYDAKHARWIASALAWHCDTDGPAGGDFSDGFVYGAISTSSDPTGDYYIFFVDYQGPLPDYPTLGLSGDKIVITANEYDFDYANGGCADDPLDPLGASVTTLEWANMLTYPLAPVNDYRSYPNMFAIRPAVIPGGSSNTIFVISETPTDANNSDVSYFTINGLISGTNNLTYSSELNLSTLGIASPFSEPPPPVDPGGALAATIVDRRPTDATWRDNVLTFVSTIHCDPAGGGAENRACARVSQLNTSTATPSAVQDMLIANTGKDTWFPGAAQSQAGALHVVYTESSSTRGMTAWHRYQLPSDAVNTLSLPADVGDGGATPYNGDRWGDYVGVAQDPRDTNAVWQGNQYTKSNGTWATNVSEIQTLGAVFVPIAPARVLDSRINLGTTGAFLANAAKTVDVAGQAGIPDKAVAVTGNLTVTNQQAAGFAAVTPIATNTPTTSTLNFPLGDVRANNVITPLGGPGGGVGIVYKAVAGKTAHLVFDVTGYFLNGSPSEGHTYNTLSPVRVLDSRPGAGNIGMVGPIPANANQTFQVAGVLGVPAGAKAITGNLTVVGQTAAGYLTLSTNPSAPIPATSTLNFPAGDVRANGVTIKLAADGKLSLVYKAAAGKTANVLLDVTGYFLNDTNGARFVPINPGRRMDTRFAAPPQGLTGPFVANVARTLVIEPYEGVPANATAIAGNLTVVGQNHAGFVSMTDVTTNSPTTSTLNFPLGDIRANGVIGPLSGSGTVGLVFKSNQGQTHLILDLTGYFR